MRRRWKVLLAAGCAVAVTACGGKAGSDPADRGTDDPAGLTYGYGPVRDGTYEYQKDVVFVDGGPSAVRTASGNGLVWTVKGDAKGVKDLQVGKVMYLTSRAVGRVAKLEPAGDDVAVTLEPVNLTDVFSNAKFDFSQAIADDSIMFQEIPEAPAQLTTLATPAAYDTADGAVVALPAMRVVPTRDLPPAAQKKATAQVSVGDWDISAYRGGGKLGLKIGTKLGKNLKVFIDFALKTKNLKVRGNFGISGGQVGSGSTFALDGVTGVAVSLSGGAAKGAADNTKVRIEVPLEWPVVIPGEPLVLVFSNKFIVTTAFGGNNTTIEAAGEWNLDGTIGLVDGALRSPTLTVAKSIMDSITGISIGVTGLAFAVETRVQFGIGIPAALAGPFFKIVWDFAVTNGSAFGASLTRCIGATLDGRVGGGFGVSLSSEALDWIQKLLPTKVKYKLEKEATVAFVHKSQVLPDVPLCQG